MSTDIGRILATILITLGVFLAIYAVSILFSHIFRKIKKY